MTEEMKARLIAKHAEELKDVNEYHELAEAAHEKHPEASRIFRDISHEEATHAKMLEHLISKM